MQEILTFQITVKCDILYEILLYHVPPCNVQEILISGGRHMKLNRMFLVMKIPEIFPLSYTIAATLYQEMYNKFRISVT